MRKVLALWFALLALPAFAQSVTTSPPAPGQLPGTGTSDNASAGNVGEYVISSTVPCTTTTGLTSNTGTNVASISLTPGDWQVEGQAGIDPAASTVVTFMNGAVTTTSAGLPADGALGRYTWTGSITGTLLHFATGGIRVSAASTTTVYLTVYATFTTSTAGSCGTIEARRVR